MVDVKSDAYRNTPSTLLPPSSNDGGSSIDVKSEEYQNTPSTLLNKPERRSGESSREYQQRVAQEKKAVKQLQGSFGGQEQLPSTLKRLSSRTGDRYVKEGNQINIYSERQLQPAQTQSQTSSQVSRVEPAQEVNPTRSRVKGAVTRFYERRIEPIFTEEKFSNFRKGAVASSVALGVGAVSSPALAGIGTVGSSVAPTLTRVVGYGAGVGLAGYTVGTTARNIYDAPTPKERLDTALITGVSVLGFTAGATAGTRATSRLSGYLRTAGREYVPPEQIIEPKVLAEQKTFPTAPRSRQLSQFQLETYALPRETRQGVYHVSPQPFPQRTVTQVGTSEIAGLYTSPSASIYFGRVTSQETATLGLQILNPRSRPTIQRIYPQDIQLGEYSRTQLYGGRPAYKIVQDDYGVAYVPLMKTEVEAIIKPQTEITRTGTQFYTSYKGQRIPIQQYEVTGYTPAKATSRPTGFTSYEYTQPRTEVPLISFRGSSKQPRTSNVQIGSSVALSLPRSQRPSSSRSTQASNILVPALNRSAGSSTRVPRITTPPPVPRITTVPRNTRIPDVPRPRISRSREITTPDVPPSQFKINFELGIGKQRARKVRAVPLKAYFPDYVSLVTGRRGKKFKGVSTGFETRPIPAGFNVNRLRISRVRRRKKKRRS